MRTQGSKNGWQEPPVRRERTGWRDLDLNDRHRRWGWNAPAVDIDFLEFDNGQPIAIMEYKESRAAPVNPTDKKLLALCTLATQAGISFFFIRYWKTPEWRFSIRAVNDVGWFKLRKFCQQSPTAKGIQRHQPVTMREIDYVRFLYWLRQRPVPDAIRRLCVPNSRAS